jgi:predicted CXXCH cytochrome family protein
METERVHPPAARDCLRCHLPHFSVEASLLAQPLQTQCTECHEADRDSFRDAHLAIDASVMNCVSCHTPHTSKDPKFFKTKVHGPFAVRTCDPCHIVEKK